MDKSQVLNPWYLATVHYFQSRSFETSKHTLRVTGVTSLESTTNSWTVFAKMKSEPFYRIFTLHMDPNKEGFWDGLTLNKENDLSTEDLRMIVRYWFGLHLTDERELQPLYSLWNNSCIPHQVLIDNYRRNNIRDYGAWGQVDPESPTFSYFIEELPLDFSDYPHPEAFPNIFRILHLVERFRLSEEASSRILAWIKAWEPVSMKMHHFGPSFLYIHATLANGDIHQITFFVDGHMISGRALDVEENS
jgi:hypothetical protein